MLDYCHTFKEIAINVTERIDPKKNKNIPYIGLEHLQQNSFNPKELGTSEEVEGQKFIMQKGDVLFGRRRAYQRKVGIAPCYGMFSAHGMILRPKTNVIVSELLPFFIRSDAFMKEAINRSSGSLSPTLNWKDIQNIHFKIPVKDEQLRISGVLWKLEELKENYLARSVLLDELVKSRFIEMFSNYKFNNSLKDVLKNVTDGTHKTPQYLENGVLFISAKNIGTGNIDLTDVKYISNEEYRSIQKRCNIEKGDILLSKSGSLGSPVVNNLEVPFGIFESIAVLKPDYSKLTSVFLCEVLKSPQIQRQFSTITKGSSIKHLHIGMIEKVQICLPPLDEQISYQKFVEQIDKTKSMLNKQIEKTIKLQQSILNNNIKCVE